MLSDQVHPGLSFHQFFLRRPLLVSRETGWIGLARISCTTASSAPSPAGRPYCIKRAAASVAERSCACRSRTASPVRVSTATPSGGVC